jgi:hypothetical protein
MEDPRGSQAWVQVTVLPSQILPQFAVEQGLHEEGEEHYFLRKSSIFLLLLTKWS